MVVGETRELPAGHDLTESKVVSHRQQLMTLTCAGFSPLGLQVVAETVVFRDGRSRQLAEFRYTQCALPGELQDPERLEDI